MPGIEGTNYFMVPPVQGLERVTSYGKSVQSGFWCFLFSFSSASVSGTGYESICLLKKGMHFQVTCMLLVSYLHFSLCPETERSAIVIIYMNFVGLSFTY